MIHYDLLTGQAHSNEYGTYETYGITASRCGNIVCTIEDISLEKNKVEQLVKLCNEEHLPPAHLEETVENFLYDFTI